ncbi:MAG TPA: hypothetical protein VGJ67_00780 [Actinomycetota bacterium]
MVYAMAAVIVGGTVASAVPGVRPSPSDHPSPSFAPSPAPSPSVLPTPEPSESPVATPEPTTVESPRPLEEKDPGPTGSEGSEKESGDPEGSHASSSAPDFSACDGLTGLENAVCRHQVLLQLHPGNAGLANALAHLRENLDKHASSGSGSLHGHGNPRGENPD